MKQCSILSADPVNLAIIRPTQHFKVLTADNLNMRHTLSLQKNYVETALLACTSYLTEERRIEKIKTLTGEFQNNLSLQAYQEQLTLIQCIKDLGIFVQTLSEDKKVYANTGLDFFSDQIFVTDTGHYYDKEGELFFIPAHFKNEQRQGEEVQAIAKAIELGASIHFLRSPSGRKLFFEGGDIRQMQGKKLFFVGYGFRSDAEAGHMIALCSDYHVLPIQLLQEQFYHLDSCFLPLPNDAAVIYEGDYALDVNGNYIYDEHGWPIIIDGTNTMSAESRAHIRSLYPPFKLILISRLEALAFATNAVILQSALDGRFKMFVNGERHSVGNERVALKAHVISYTQSHLTEIMQATEGVMDIIETPYRTMHLSGGSVRCTVQEVAYHRNSVQHQASSVLKTLNKRPKILPAINYPL